MIVDMHTHTFPEKIAVSTIEKLADAAHIMPYCNGTRSDLTASMQAAGIDWSVVLPVATNERQVPKVNDAAAELNRQADQQGVFSFGCIHPDYPQWKAELDRVAQLGLKGVKLHPYYQRTPIDDPKYLRILEYCGQLGLVVVSHAGVDVGFPREVMCSPAMFRNAVRQVGPVKLILAHMGGWYNWDRVIDELADTSVCLDTSFSLGKMVPRDDHYREEELNLLSGEQFLEIVRAFGAHRIFFGTDNPWGGQRETLELFRKLPFTEEEKQAILGENARQLLQLN